MSTIRQSTGTGNHIMVGDMPRSTSQPTSATADRHQGVGAFDGAKLAARRKLLGWSQGRLAEELAQVQSDKTGGPAAPHRVRTLVVQISLYESGKQKPRPSTVGELARALGLGGDELLSGPRRRELRTLRCALGRSQADIAQCLSVSRGHYAHVEQGRAHLDVGQIAALAACLGTTDAEITRAITRAQQVRRNSSASA
jgi:transcriptional regulator with XRE-family HTH domain